MQHKLTLDLDTLQVDSFHASPDISETRGTVEGREAYLPCPSAGYPQSCATRHTCVSFDISCRAEN